MAWAADSTQPGYLGPSPTETLDQLDWENFLQACVAGISGLPGTLVRPRWQPNPPPTPDVTIDWAACGITRTTGRFSPYHHHYAETEPGFDRSSRQEQVFYRVSFYGPHAGDLCAILRDGLFIDQNRQLWRENAVGLVEAERIDHVPELFRQQWRDAYHLEIILNREVRRVYNVRTLLRAKGTITGNDWGKRTVTTTFDTAQAIVPGTLWDIGLSRAAQGTVWDDGATIWDAEKP